MEVDLPLLLPPSSVLPPIACLTLGQARLGGDNLAVRSWIEITQPVGELYAPQLRVLFIQSAGDHSVPELPTYRFARLTYTI